MRTSKQITDEIEKLRHDLVLVRQVEDQKLERELRKKWVGKCFRTWSTMKNHEDDDPYMEYTSVKRIDDVKVSPWNRVYTITEVHLMRRKTRVRDPDARGRTEEYLVDVSTFDLQRGRDDDTIFGDDKKIVSKVLFNSLMKYADSVKTKINRMVKKPCKEEKKK